MAGALIRRDRAMISLNVMLDVAFHVGKSYVVTAAELSGRLGLSRRGMEPLLQALSRAGLLDSERGPRGGYRLGRPARDITVLQVVAVALTEDGNAADVTRGELHAAAIEPLWEEMEARLREDFGNLTLLDLIRRAEACGLRRPATEPISFAI